MKSQRWSRIASLPLFPFSPSSRNPAEATRPSLPGVALAVLALGWGCAGAGPEPALREQETWARGVVFHDRDGDGARDRFERGLRGVVVSNGREVVRTDWRGRYRIPIREDTALFVVKPRGYAPPTDANGLPRFYYVHKPAGSPGDLAFPGVAPTGPLPASVDFPLHAQEEPERFRVLLFGDPQPRRLEHLDHLARDVVSQLAGSDAAFGISLGDLVHDDLALFEPLNRVVGRIGVPWYNVHGNHDVNFDAAHDRHADETFERVYGPATYAFQHAAAHFVVLDDVVYAGAGVDGAPGPYTVGFTDDQMAFLERYLAGVPRDELVVLAMHIPFAGGRPEAPRAREILRMLSAHPHTLSLSGHTHLQEHRFLDVDAGGAAEAPHHHFNVGTTSGSWWLGARDEAGIPHATMRDGTPNGYAVLEIDGHDYTIRFRAARRPPEQQLRVHAPPTVGAAGGAEVLVNFFAGSERASVEMRLGEGEWRALAREPRRDPRYVATRDAEIARGEPEERQLPPAVVSPHMWVGRLPASPPGDHVLEVRARDMFGQVWTALRLLRVD